MTARYTGLALLRDLPPRARGYIVTVIAVGGLTFALLLPRATLFPILPLVVFALLSSLPWRLLGAAGLYLLPLLGGLLLLPAVWSLTGLLPGAHRSEAGASDRRPRYLLRRESAFVFGARAARAAGRQQL